MSKRKSTSRGNLRSRSAGLRREFEEKLAALVEIPSVSMDPSCRIDVEKVAQQGCALLRELGAQATCIKTAGLPLVLGRLVQDPKFPTVTIYNHLDVQPADAEEWRSPPFKLVRDGDRWLGRGTTDDKGPALAALFGARLALQDGVPLNFQFLWETEEEMGSPSFEAALRKLAKADKPLRTDSIVVSDSLWPQAGRPAIPYGLRGLVDSVCACKPATRMCTRGRPAARPATARRIVRAHQRLLRRPHRPGEDTRLLPRRSSPRRRRAPWSL